jgi:hypothetical protein
VAAASTHADPDLVIRVDFSYPRIPEPLASGAWGPMARWLRLS